VTGVLKGVSAVFFILVLMLQPPQKNARIHRFTAWYDVGLLSVPFLYCGCVSAGMVNYSELNVEIL
jgi:hypothetical protein